MQKYTSNKSNKDFFESPCIKKSKHFPTKFSKPGLLKEPIQAAYLQEVDKLILKIVKIIFVFLYVFLPYK